MIRETEKINVLNYNENRVSIRVSPTESYNFEPSTDGVIPKSIPLTIDQIRYANNYNAFRDGLLFFEDAKAKDVYEAIGISDWKNILTNDNIRSIILHPTFEGLQKIISIKNSTTFERVRAAYQKLKFENTQDISIRVAQIIETRYKELQAGKVNTTIVLEKRDLTPKDNEEVKALKAENEDMKKEIEEMKKMIASLAGKSSNNQQDYKKASNKTTYPKNDGKAS